MNTSIREEISIHDKYRFEIKIELQGSSIYNIEYYFFLPSSLNISYYTYDKSKFYSSLQRYIRYKNPDIPISALFDQSNDLSPYNRVLKLLEEMKSKKEDSYLIESAIDELKLLGSIIKEELNRLYNNFKQMTGYTHDDMLVFLLRVDEGIGELKKKIYSFDFNKKVIDSFRYVDEYITLLKIETLSKIIYNEKEQKGNYPQLLNYINKLNKYIEVEHYSRITPDNIDHFLYYRGLLKKFVSSCLFLKTNPGFNFYYHLISGVASAVAMLFAVIVSIYAQRKYSITSSMFIFILVISYVFKDRIKEFIKIAFSKWAGEYIFDRKVKISEPSHNIRIGYIKESFSILALDNIPSYICYLRNKDNLTVVDEDAKNEVVLKYKKIIKLNRSIINSRHIRRKNLVTILRFSMDDFIKHTDNEEIPYNFNGEVFKARKVYHMNIVVRYSDESNRTYYDRYRVVFNRSGILKVEKVL